MSHTDISTLSTVDAATQKEILESGNGWDAYHYALHVPGADIPALQRVVLERGEARDLLNFARDIPDANLADIHIHLQILFNVNANNRSFLHSFNTDTGIQERLERMRDQRYSGLYQVKRPK